MHNIDRSLNKLIHKIPSEQPGRIETSHMGCPQGSVFRRTGKARSATSTTSCENTQFCWRQFIGHHTHRKNKQQGQRGISHHGFRWRRGWATHTRLEANDECDEETPQQSCYTGERARDLDGNRRDGHEESSAKKELGWQGEGCSLHATSEDRQRVWMRRFLAKWKTPAISRHHGGSCAEQRAGGGVLAVEKRGVGGIGMEQGTGVPCAHERAERGPERRARRGR
jgi:hypothetical protein